MSEQERNKQRARDYFDALDRNDTGSLLDFSQMTVLLR